MNSDLSEYEKMKKNCPFNPADKALVALRAKMRDIELIYNSTGRYDTEQRRELMESVLERCGIDVIFLPNIHFDYGCNIKIGNHFFANVNSTFIDVASITIGDNVLIGPNVTICTATHPIQADKRLPQKNDQGNAVMLEYGKPVIIDDQVWIGAGVIINPGVHIGAKAVIGSGSVVTRDIPSNVVAAGVPCRILRNIENIELNDNICQENT